MSPVQGPLQVSWSLSMPCFLKCVASKNVVPWLFYSIPIARITWCVIFAYLSASFLWIVWQGSLNVVIIYTLWQKDTRTCSALLLWIFNSCGTETHVAHIIVCCSLLIPCHPWSLSANLDFEKEEKIEVCRPWPKLNILKIQDPPHFKIVMSGHFCLFFILLW